MSGASRWLRTNAVALAALALLATSSIWYAFTIDWQQYQQSRPTELIEVPRGSVAAYAGGSFAIDELVVVEGDSADGTRYQVPAGTDLVVVDLAISPRVDGDPDDFVGCEIRFVAPSPDGEREWWPESTNPSSYPDPVAEAFGCNVAGGAAYSYRQYFVVPAGGAVDGAVQITIREELPRALRLR